MAERKKTNNNRKNVSRASDSAKQSASSPKKPPNDKAAAADIQRKAGIMGILTIILAIFLFIALSMEVTGPVGMILDRFLKGLFSNAAYVICFMLAWIGVSSFLAPRIRTSAKYWLLLATTIFVAIAIHLFSYHATSHDDVDFTVSYLYRWGSYGIYGGVIGGGIGNFLIRFIDVVGAWLVAIAGILITFILITGISIQIVLSKFGEKIKAWRLRAKEERYIAEQERLELLEKIDAEREKKVLAANGSAEVATIRPSNGERVAPAKRGYFDKYFKKDSSVEPEETVAVDDAPWQPEESESSVAPTRQFSLSIDNIQEASAVSDDNNDIDDGEFQPPSLTQKREELEANVQAALDKGVPMDEAVSWAKRGNIEEVEELAAVPTFENTPIPNYTPPPLSLLSPPPKHKQTPAQRKRELEIKADKLESTLASFGVDAKIEKVVQGPTVTRFETYPGTGVKVNKITNLTDDIALALAASGVIIAPVAGKSAIGIEIPNEIPEMVSVKEVIDTEEFENFNSKTAFALGKDIAGNIIIADIAKMPHLLVAGATGSGKSVCINSLVTSVLYKAKPNEVKMIMIDPKMVELTIYNGIPHLFIPVVTDSKKAASALNWAVIEMENRYKLFETNRCRNLAAYNELVEREGGGEEAKLPEIIIIIDELADLMMVAKSEVEASISRLAAKARAAGMYLVIATQRPSVDVITGVIKANVPSRISFAVSSHIDSRTILDSQGAEKLLGRGDMLYYPYGAAKPMRIQGNFVSDADVEKVVEFVKAQNTMEYDEEIIQQIESINESQKIEDEEDNPGNADELLSKAIEMAIELSQASVAMLQRRFKIGYQRAARIIDQMEERGIIGQYEGTKPRQVLISKEEFLEMSAANDW